MNELQQYLTSQFHSDKQEIARVELLIADLVNTLLATFDNKMGWPYQISRAAGPEKISEISLSTSSMVAASLDKVRSLAGPTNSSVNRLPFAPRKDDLAKLVNAISGAKRLILAEISEGTTSSKTYGTDDPVTLAFLSRLCENSPDWHAGREYIEKRSRTLCAQNVFDPHSLLVPPDKEHKPISNALIPLRAAQSATNVVPHALPDLSMYGQFFETRLHEHLSFSSIPDSRFDPGELTFCLEGLLLCKPEVVDHSLIKRVLEVLTHAQKESAFLRPNKPILATSKGFSLFPVSVEITNSLVRSCVSYDGDELFDTVSSLSIELFRRYWRWLRARTIRFSVGEHEYVGWNSEHVNESATIHVWETSQVLEFLVGYRTLLQRHVARQTLTLSKFNFKPFSLPRSGDDWSKIENDYEPVTCLGDNYKCYHSIGKDFVAGWKSKNRSNYSMLLYGPPGTGKTTVAENLTKALNTRIINISVSDFLAGGSAEVEARAKAIFEVLNSQLDCVVLLDEIDQLILDRESARYSAQTDVFQFMTPGMLTKLNDLRASERVLFVIATNYANRIDSAIKRPGRIDQQYLVLPPDRAARKAILRKVLRDLQPPVNCEINEQKLTDAHWHELQSASLYLSFKEIEATVTSALRSSKATVANLAKLFKDRPRTTSLASYEQRFVTATGAMQETPPAEEFACLLALALEDDTQEPDADRAGAVAAKWFARGEKNKIHTEVPKFAGALPDEHMKRVVEWLEAKYVGSSS